MDKDWWRVYREEAGQVFAGELVTQQPNCYGVRRVEFQPQYRNSGASAIGLAVHLGAQRVILLGYDCQKTGGRAHWHGDHPKGLGNAGSLDKWPAQFAKLARDFRNFDIMNCTRETALTCFPRVPLERALNDDANGSDLAVGRESGVPA